ncbi:MAG: hypothetical protein NVS3B21_14250 [Acidimicrobiales bacterium]
MMRIAALLCTTLVAGACSVGGAGRPSTYTINAPFPTTIGLYPGSYVRQLGIDVGSITRVRNEGDHVLVSMKIAKKYRLARDAKALLVGDSVLGERYVQFEPAYVGGDPLPAGTTLAPDHVKTPVETDAVLRSLNTVLGAINPSDVKEFTTNLATLLDGQGTKLNELIGNASGTVSLLADKSNELGQLTTTLAQLSGQLRTRDQALATLIRNYDLLSGTLAADRNQIDGTITQLTNVTTSATGLLAPNLAPLKDDVAALTTVGRTLDRNLAAVDIGLTYTPRLFTAAGRAYDPQHNWLPLNSQANPDKTTAILGGSIRDTLSSLCRRLAAKNPSLAPGLTACGNPASGFFDPVVGLLPGVLQQLNNPSPPPGLPHADGPGVRAAGTGATSVAPPADASSAFAKGIAAIPGLTDDQRLSLASSPMPSAAAAPEGPIGARAVAALASSARGSVPTDDPAVVLGPRPAVRPATAPHASLLTRLLGWLGVRR